MIASLAMLSISNRANHVIGEKIPCDYILVINNFLNLKGVKMNYVGVGLVYWFELPGF